MSWVMNSLIWVSNQSVAYAIKPFACNKSHNFPTYKKKQNKQIIVVSQRNAPILTPVICFN